MLCSVLFTVLFAPQGAYSVKIYHFPVPLQSVPITVVYECAKSCDPHTTHLEATSELMQANTVCLYKYCVFLCVNCKTLLVHCLLAPRATKKQPP